jgi:hypothetical protein
MLADPYRQVRTSRWTPLGLALLCAHCSLGVLAAGASILFGALGWATGEWILAWFAPPVFILGAFVWLIRTPKETCALPAK